MTVMASMMPRHLKSSRHQVLLWAGAVTDVARAIGKPWCCWMITLASIVQGCAHGPAHL